MNREGYPDPTSERAIWGVRKEEKIRALEEKYGVHREDKVVIYNREEDRSRSPGEKRNVIKSRKMKVIGVYPNFILLQDKLGIRESFRWQEFFKKLKKE